jgi:hypothetical protein
MNPKNYDINQTVQDIKTYFEDHDKITDEDFINIVNFNKKRRFVYTP